MLASSILSQKDGNRVNSGSRRMNSSRGLTKASDGSSLSGIPGVEPTTHKQELPHGIILWNYHRSANETVSCYISSAQVHAPLSHQIY